MGLQIRAGFKVPAGTYELALDRSHVLPACGASQHALPLKYKYSALIGAPSLDAHSAVPGCTAAFNATEGIDTHVAHVRDWWIHLAGT